MPDFNDEIKEILAKRGIDTNAFKININDLVKLQTKGRAKYIKEIQPTFYKPNFVFKDEQGDIIFAKEISNRLYFANVTRLYNDDFLSVSLSPKTENTIKK